jgi:hypothetical protein
MALGTSLLLIAAGAILAFAVTWTTNGVNIQTIGDILMGVGVIGLLFSLIFMAGWFGSGRESVDHYGPEVGHPHDL